MSTSHIVKTGFIKNYVFPGAGGRYGGEGYGESYAPEYGGACAEWAEWPSEQHALIPQDKLAYPASGPCFTGAYLLLIICIYTESNARDMPPRSLRENIETSW